MSRLALVALTIVALWACTMQPPTPEEQLAREEAFKESMRGAVLDGHFTISPIDGSEAAAEGGETVKLRSERYEIERVEKTVGDIWTFHARIQFGETDVTAPVPVRLTWAGDTPVVGVTDLGLPGMGSYTARVLFFRDTYAGMWSGKSHGGNLFGQIRRPD